MYSSYWDSICAQLLKSLESLILKRVYPELDNIASMCYFSCLNLLIGSLMVCLTPSRSEERHLEVGIAIVAR